MAKEIELKLRCAPEALAPLAQHLNSIAKGLGSRQLNNTYYDTASGSLLKAKAALRIRENHTQYEQTLKTRGQAVAGLHIRGEWNWPLSSNALDGGLLRQAEITAVLPEGLNVSELEPVFSTNFCRRTWLYSQAETQIEVALDQGEVKAGSSSEPICECELELISGDPEIIWQLALALVEVVPLWLSDQSKAERGYRLAGLSERWQLSQGLVHWQEPAQPLTATASQENMNTARQQLLQAYQRYQLERPTE